MTSSKIEKLFWQLIILWALLRLVLMLLEYRGNSDPAYLLKALEYFSQKNIDDGYECAMYAFWFKAIYGYVYLFLLLIPLKLGFFSSFYTQLTSKFTQFNGWLAEILFVFLFFCFVQLLSFPSSLVFGYLRESALGFTNISFFTWLTTYFKSFLISLTLSTLGTSFVFATIYYLPKTWQYFLPLALGGISAILIILYPHILTPIFYNQVELEDVQLKQKLISLAKDAQLEVQNIFVVDSSRYSTRANAYFTGIGKHKRIVLFDTLLKQHTPEETTLIFAHELGHWKYSHITFGLLISICSSFFASILLCKSFQLLSTVEWFGLSQIYKASSLPFFFILYLLLNLVIISPIESQISQYMEKQADYTSLELTQLPDTFIKSQQKLAISNKSNLLPHPFRVFWLHTHPPAIDRISSALKF